MSKASVGAVSHFLAILLLAGGCTFANKPLNPVSLPLEQRVKNHTRAILGAPIVSPATQESADAPVHPELAKEYDDDADRNHDGYFVGLSISGGGSRSSNFAASVMFQLQRLGLLEKVDYISSVSGGSLTAAYYCASDSAEWNPENVQRRLTHGFASDMIAQALLPWNWFALAFTPWDRADLLANSLNETLYTRNGRKLTFADLRDDRPRMLINATDLQSGQPFIFCNESFDELNSDLAQYPLAYAVAASSAVPVVIHQVTLRDFSTIFESYRHLIDGGVNDNLGVKSLVHAYDSHVQASERAGRPIPFPRGVVLLVIDAKTQFDARLSDKGDIGLIDSLRMGAGLTSTVLLNRASSATLSEIVVKYSRDDVTAKQLRDQIQTLEKDGFLTLKDRHGLKVQVVHLALSRVNQLNDLPFKSFNESVNSIATYFNIDPTEAYHLNQAADLLIREVFETRLEQINRELGGGK